MISTTVIYVCVKFQSNMSKVTKAMTVGGMMGQKGFER